MGGVELEVLVRMGACRMNVMKIAGLHGLQRTIVRPSRVLRRIKMPFPQ